MAYTIEQLEQVLAEKEASLASPEPVGVLNAKNRYSVKELEDILADKEMRVGQIRGRPQEEEFIQYQPNLIPPASPKELKEIKDLYGSKQFSWVKMQAASPEMSDEQAQQAYMRQQLNLQKMAQEPIPTGIGGLAGGLKSFRVPGVSTLAAAGGEAIAQGINQAWRASQGLPLKPIGKIVGDVAGEALTQAPAELMTVPTAVANKALVQKPERLYKTLSEIDPLLKSAGTHLTMGQATTSPGIQKVEAVLERLWGSTIKELKTSEQPKALATLWKRLYPAIDALPESEAAVLLQDVIKKGGKDYFDIGSKMYDEVDKSVQRYLRKTKQVVEVPTGMLDAYGKPIMKEVSKIVRGYPPEAMVDLSPLVRRANKNKTLGDLLQNIGGVQEGDQFAAKTSKLPPKVDFLTAHSLDKRLTSVINSPASDVARREAIEAQQALRNAMEFTGNRMKGAGMADAYDKLKQAREYWRSGEEVFGNDVIKSLLTKLKDKPESLVKMAFNDIETVRRIKGAMPKKDFEKVADVFSRKLLDDTSRYVEEIGETVPRGARGTAKLKRMSRDMLVEAKGQDWVKNFELTLSAANHLQVANPYKGSGGIITAMIMASPILNVYRNISEGEYGTAVTKGVASYIPIWLTGRGLSKIFANKNATELLINGLKQPATSKALVSIALRLDRFVGKNIAIEQTLKQKEEELKKAKK